MKLSDFSYEFPDELIATEPLKDRDASRMMVVDRTNGSLAHSFVREFPSFLRRGDVVVINDTRVFPARLIGKKESGGYFEILLLRKGVISPGPSLERRGGLPPPFLKGGEGGFGRKWKCITNQTKTSKPGLKILFGDELVGTIVARENDELIIEFNKPELIENVGLPPVPPYIRKMRGEGRREKEEGRGKKLPSSFSLLPSSSDKERYQTIYARETGSAAAPTAGLHFTDDLLKRIGDAGAEIAKVTLHVGLDTFSPVRVKNIEDHKMHGEEYSVPQETIDIIADAKKNGGRVIAIGTTSVRALESYEGRGTKDEGRRICYCCDDEARDDAGRCRDSSKPER